MRRRSTEGTARRGKHGFAIAATLLMLVMPLTGVTASEDTPEAWEQAARLVPGQLPSDAGSAVALDGDRVILGAPSDGDAGAAYVFERNDDGTWSQTARLEPDPAAADAMAFGTTVALEGNLAVIGDSEDPGMGASQGGAFYVFEETNGAWTQTHLVTPPADRTHDDSEFAKSMALEGDTLFVGAQGQNTAVGEDTGAVFVYTVTASSVALEQVFTADDAGTNDFFGNDVAISGSTALVSALIHDVDGQTSAGAVYVFERLGDGTWVQGEKLTAPTPTAREQFGETVSLDQGTGLVTSLDAAYVFEDDGGWSHAQTLLDENVSSIHFHSPQDGAIDGDRIVLGTQSLYTEPLTGIVVFEKDGDTWTRTAGIQSEARFLDDLRGPVALDGDRFVGGTNGALTLDSYTQGGALVFEPCQPSGAAGQIDGTVVENAPDAARDDLREANCNWVERGPV